MTQIRFDDLTPGAGASFELVGIVEEFVAHHVDDVESAISAAEQAARDGHWVAGFIAYEAAPAFDSALTTNPPHHSTPLVWMAAFRERREAEPLASPAVPASGGWEATVDEARFRSSIDEIRDRIEAGDTYQVNYSYRLRRAAAEPAFDLYARLALAQRSAYSAFMDTGTLQVASASPELFFELDGRRIRTRPMKGTAPRGRNAREDEAMGAVLAASEKDRAENLMIVDLLRNDLGRISEFGTVEVDSLFDVERFETLWQMTSTISATLRPDVGLPGTFRALFPCASITGAPKASTMEIIRDLEPDPRGVYCGAIGFIEPGADRAVFSVAIRTVVIDPSTDTVEYGVGGGITWDSTADGELVETRTKALVLTRSRPVRLIETMLWDGSSIPHLDRHLDRLGTSADFLGFELPEHDVRSVVMAAADRTDPGPQRVRLTLDRAGRLEALATPLHDPPNPVRLAVDTEPVDSTDPMLLHKVEPRWIYDERARRHPGADQVVLINERGEVTETTIANLVVSIGGRWVTPPLDSGCLPGVQRASLLADGRIEEGVVMLDDLRTADAIAVVSALRGWLPAILL